MRPRTFSGIVRPLYEASINWMMLPLDAAYPSGPSLEGDRMADVLFFRLVVVITEYTEWQRLLSGLHSIMLEKFA
jgi:hypothetical protein